MATYNSAASLFSTASRTSLDDACSWLCFRDLASNGPDVISMPGRYDFKRETNAISKTTVAPKASKSAAA